MYDPSANKTEVYMGNSLDKNGYPIVHKLDPEKVDISKAMDWNEAKEMISEQEAKKQIESYGIKCLACDHKVDNEGMNYCKKRRKFFKMMKVNQLKKGCKHYA